MAQQFKVRPAEQVRHVYLSPGIKVVDAQYVVPLTEKVLAKMGAQKPRSAGHHDSLHFGLPLIDERNCEIGEMLACGESHPELHIGLDGVVGLEQGLSNPTQRIVIAPTLPEVLVAAATPTNRRRIRQVNRRPAFVADQRCRRRKRTVVWILVLLRSTPLAGNSGGKSSFALIEKPTDGISHRIL